MAFKKGNKKIGGRKKGEANKKTLILDSFAKSVIDGGMEKFNEELNKLTGATYVNAFMSLFEYVKPKLSRMEATVENKNNYDLSKLSIQELKQLKSLQNKIMNDIYNT